MSVRLMQLYGPGDEAREGVKSFFQGIRDAHVKIAPHGDLLTVTAPASSIEKYLNTRLAVVSHRGKRVVRAVEALSSIPDDLAALIAFISLNTPVHLPRSSTSSDQDEMLRDTANNSFTTTFGSVISVKGGNEEALLSFRVICGDGSPNRYSPPCANLPLEDQPTFTVSVTKHANDKSNPYVLSETPLLEFTVLPGQVYCYNSTSSSTSSMCVIKASPLPKYAQLRVNITLSYPSSSAGSTTLSSRLFALTDVATASFLSTLYNIPKGLRVNHGSNQSVAEFYGEFYSNNDLSSFLQLSGLPNASIPNSNVFGDLMNNQSNPGGEAQLDVEYIMALAPGAETYFYSMGNYNPNDPPGHLTNEGFLSYLQVVEMQEYPPLVHSLSYGDIEGEIFNASHRGSVKYGERCDQEFMQMGLRGLTIVFSSGDDGIAGSDIRTDPETACRRARPSWPASSPYVTAVGATQLTDKYLPICEESYDLRTTLPQSLQLPFQCTGTAETVCSGTFGGVITSGGGFSAVYNRSSTAPWQEAAVSAYLSASNTRKYPPEYYFNSRGRGYPDVSTYGSNYFVYLNGAITRESGTSASAPVFAAMVTLWNDMRLAYNLPPLGFVAPFLYYAWSITPHAFQDIVTGNNACGVGSSLETTNCCDYFFAATSGWDAVTGLGSPNFQVIASLVLNNQTFFPSMGAYPFGGTPSRPNNIIVANYDGISAIEKSSLQAALGLAISSFLIGLVSLVIGIYFVYLRSKPHHPLSAEELDQDFSTLGNNRSNPLLTA